VTAARRDCNAATSWGETLGSEGRLREAEKAVLATASCFCKSCYRGNGEAVPEASVAPLMGGGRHSVRSDMRCELMEIEMQIIFVRRGQLEQRHMLTDNKKPQHRADLVCCLEAASGSYTLLFDSK
jgi:hypothetical protein